MPDAVAQVRRQPRSKTAACQVCFTLGTKGTTCSTGSRSRRRWP